MNPPPIPPAPVSNQSGLATASMVCGFLALPTCFATALPAIILGHIAWSKGGKPGRAKLGLIFGYGSLVLIPVIAAIAGFMAPLVIRQRHKADQAECVGNVRQIGMALEEYQSEHGEFPPELSRLEDEGIIKDLDALLRVRATHEGEWLYFPKAKPADTPAPLLISPPIDHKTVVLRVDQSVTLQARSGEPESGDPPVRIPVPLQVGR